MLVDDGKHLLLTLTSVVNDADFEQCGDGAESRLHVTGDGTAETRWQITSQRERSLLTLG